MTRSMNKPESPKHRNSRTGSQVARHSDGSVSKRRSSSPVERSIKMLTNNSTAPRTQQECVSKLKKLLPKTNEEEEITELALVERTIAYISYLEEILKATNGGQDFTAIQSTVDLFQKMAV